MDKEEKNSKKGGKEKKRVKVAKSSLFKIDKDIKESMAGFFMEFFSLGGLILLIIGIIALKFLEALGLIEVNVPFL